MQTIDVLPKRFRCNMCGKKYPRKGQAEGCFEVHRKAINTLIAGYKPGAQIEVHYFKDLDCAIVPVTIVKTRGELTNFEVLVEHEDGSRWWEEIVAFQSDDSEPESIRNQPTSFWSRHPLISLLTNY